MPKGYGLLQPPFYVYVFVFELAKIHLTETMCVEAKRVFISVYNIC